MRLEPRYSREGIVIHEGDALAVAASLPADHCTLAILDGPYAMNKAAWDRLKVADLPRFYRPHLEAADRILMPSASLYLWNTAEGWATLHPLMLSMGWTFKALLIWDKLTVPTLLGWKTSSAPINRYEVAGYYVRGRAAFHPDAGCKSNIWPMAIESYRAEFFRTVEPIQNRNLYRGMTYPALHPCQKPLLFAERMIRASTRPGERVWVPFGGTCREAIAADRIRRADPSEAREVITAELNQDGVDYLEPVIRILNGEGSRAIDPKQAVLF